MGNGARTKNIYQGARGKIKKEQGAKRDEKGAVKIGKKERAPKNGREQGERGKMSKVVGSIDPPQTEPGWCKLRGILKQNILFEEGHQICSMSTPGKNIPIV